jgi:hypothetical protein
VCALSVPARAEDAPASDAPAEKSSGKSSGGSSAPKMPALSSAGASSTPQGRPFGFGLQLGYPTAVTLKYMLQPDQGIVAGIGGFSGFVYNAPALSLHVDYVWHPHQFTSTDVFALTWYFGGGGNVLIFNTPRYNPFIPWFEYYYSPTNIWLAARMPFGANIAFAQWPFEVYFELVPQLVVFPGVGFGLGGAIGFRFYL